MVSTDCMNMYPYLFTSDVGKGPLLIGSALLDVVWWLSQPARPADICVGWLPRFKNNLCFPPQTWWGYFVAQTEASAFKFVPEGLLCSSLIRTAKQSFLMPSKVAVVCPLRKVQSMNCRMTSFLVLLFQLCSF